MNTTDQYLEFLQEGSHLIREGSEDEASDIDPKIMSKVKKIMKLKVKVCNKIKQKTHKGKCEFWKCFYPVIVNKIKVETNIYKLKGPSYCKQRYSGWDQKLCLRQLKFHLRQLKDELQGIKDDYERCL